MANLTPSSILDDVYRLETTDPVFGGVGGISNTQPQQLLNRTEWLKDILVNQGYTEALTFGGNLGTLKTPGFYIILAAATSKPPGVTANGFCVVIGNNTSGGGSSEYSHIFVDRNLNMYVRAYQSAAPLGDWVPMQSATAYLAEEADKLGVIDRFSTNVSRTNWLYCLGQEISRTTYSALFAVIGTKYGVGNGTTTFDLPDLENQADIGVDTFFYFMKVF